MILEFREAGDSLILVYWPEQDASWLNALLQQHKEISIRRTFHFRRDERVPSSPKDFPDDSDLNDEQVFAFRFADLEGEYHRIPGRRLGIEHDVFIHRSFPLEQRHFLAPRRVSVFGHIAALTPKAIYIGGDSEEAIPAAAFEIIVAQFPSEIELVKYVRSRVSAVLRNYVDGSKDAKADYEAYRNRRENSVRRSFAESFEPYELRKFEAVRQKLAVMLADEDGFSEKQWQAEIKDIVCLIYPKYLMAFPEAPIRDSHRNKDRSVDYILMDHDGNIDALEIKKPSDQAVITHSTYRDNHIPMRELSGAVIQVEKYLYHLVRSGERGIAELNRKYASFLPAGVSIKVTNPAGLLLLGRDEGLTTEQKLDFEVVKRHYRNVVDIVTYDDLLRRLGAKINSLSTRFRNGPLLEPSAE